MHEDEIFAEAIEIRDPTRRRAFLDSRCAESPTLRASLDDLLALHDTDNEFLETPVLAPMPPAREEASGQVLDRYRLVERLGEGGFGVVWKAEQLQPVRRDVALKILRPGMDTRSIIRRFEAERQTLAMMKHPGIATVLDAGTIESEELPQDTNQTRRAAPRPYFVMELVEGQAIDRYCSEHRLTLRRRLELYVAVCRAVQHAHQKGVVHRDLKPSNVLISEVDGVAVPKVIDFGIAKAVDGIDTSARDCDQSPERLSRPTHTSGRLMGTPQYMSPEQLRGDTDIDTRADVYALGSLLYQLLAGSPPFAYSAHSSVAFVDFARTVLNSEPSPPSRRLAEVLKPLGDGTDAPFGGDTRSPQPPDVVRVVPSNLDWITLKALSRRRADRYDSAAELARDIERHLANEPVLAAPQGLRYRAACFARRNVKTVLTAAMVTVALLTGTVLATIGLVQAKQEQRRTVQQWQRAEREKTTARREREKARAEAAKALLVSRHLEELINGADPTFGHPADLTMRDQVEQFAKSIEGHFQDFPLIEARLRRTLGRIYLSLREYASARPQLQRALTLRQQQLHDEHPLLTQIQVDFATFLYFDTQADRAEALLTPALNRLREAGPVAELVQALSTMARIRGDFGRDPERDELFQEAWTAARAYYGESHPASLRLAANVAIIRMRTGRSDEGEQMLREALDLMLDHRPRDHLDVAYIKYRLAQVLIYQQREDEAEPLLREAIDVHERMYGDDNIAVARGLTMLAGILRKKPDRFDEALTLTRDAHARVEHITGGSQFTRAQIYRQIALVLRRVDSLAAAGASTKSIALLHQVRPEDPQLVESLHHHAQLLQDAQYWDQAAACYDEIRGLQEKISVPPVMVAKTLEASALMNQAAGRSPVAVEQLREAIKLTTGNTVSRRLPAGQQAARCRLALVRILLHTDQPDRAAEETELMMLIADTSRLPINRLVALVAQAEMMMDGARYEDAVVQLRRALTVGRPRDRLPAHLALSRCLAHMNDTAGAREQLTIARTLTRRQIDRRQTAQQSAALDAAEADSIARH